jgi:hypothetical protein
MNTHDPASQALSWVAALLPALARAVPSAPRNSYINATIHHSLGLENDCAIFHWRQLANIKELACQHGLSDTGAANGLDPPGPLGRCAGPGLRK